MGQLAKGTMVPRLSCLMDARFLFFTFLLVLCDATKLMDFPGPASCLEDRIQVTKPEGINKRSWRNVSLVDSKGNEAACDLHINGSLLTIPKKCLNHEFGSMVAYVAFKKQKNVYKIACSDYQADPAFDGPVIECNNDFMKFKIPRTTPGFSDEVAVLPTSAWMLKIGTQTFSVTQAKNAGYTLTSDDTHFIIKAEFNATGIYLDKCSGQKFYRGDFELIYGGINPKISVDVIMVCARGPFTCTNPLTICIPKIGGIVKHVEVDGDTSYGNYGVTVEDSGSIIAIDKDKLERMPDREPPFYYYPWELVLGLEVDDSFVAMALSPTCVDIFDPPNAQCKDGFMRIEVYSAQTTPYLDLSTVILAQNQCLPVNKTNNFIVYYFPVNDCGTTKTFVDGKLIYEIEIHATWRDRSNPKYELISRDSELRETLRCVFNDSGVKHFPVTVAGQTAPPVSDGYGPLSLVLNLYQEGAYRAVYSNEQYPVIKTLRDPIYLEVQVLNRNDPDLELRLNNCWATMSQDPTATPQWNVVINGCQENEDDYLTVFHQVSNVDLPRLRKRFEVKAFAFLLDNDLSPNFVYFHCSAFMCNVNSPDYPLCTNSCPSFRRKRDELFLERHSILASLPGPVFFADVDRVLNTQDEDHVIKQVTLGVLPAFGLVALIVLLAVLLPVFKRKLQS